jgi:hypothetical protein
MEQLTPLLEKLSGQLGTTIEQLWGTLLKQTQVEIELCRLWMGIWLWGGIGILALAIITIFLAVKSDEDEIIPLIVVIMTMFIVLAVVGYSINYSELLTLTKNPEYWALKEILKALGN